MARSGLTIGRLAALTGVHLETVRYYERIGLMPAPARTEGGHRLYADAHRRRLAFVHKARQLGFTLKDIGALLALSEPPARSCADVKVIANAHLETVRAKIADLRRLERLLEGAVEGCGAEDASCPVLDMLESS